jgi:hypothetical protein
MIIRLGVPVSSEGRVREGCGMEAIGKQQEGFHRLPWWRVNPDELRRQVEGYETLGMLDSSRGRSFLLAMLSAIVCAAVGIVVAASAVAGGWPGIGVGEMSVLTVCTLLGEGMVFFLLGCLVRRGNAWAAIGLMGLCSFDRVFEAAVSNSYAVPGQPHGVWMIPAVPVWCFYMYTFWMTFRIERAHARLTAHGL